LQKTVKIKFFSKNSLRFVFPISKCDKTNQPLKSMHPHVLYTCYLGVAVFSR
jgi:hypothetical protein